MSTIARLHLIARMMQRRDTPTVHEDRIEADMHEDLHPIRRRNRKSVLRIKEQRDLPIAGCQHRIPLEMDREAVAGQALGEHRIRHRIEGNGLPRNGRDEMEFCCFV